jgi:transcriptional regulator with XRE-family HTH domain
MESFGSFIKSKRIENNITLRHFCKETDIDPSNWSKIERELAPPPKSNSMLERIAKTLGLKQGSEDYNTMFDLAIISFIPRELISENELNRLPVFFRTTRGDAPTEEELRKLIERLKE